MSTIRRGHFVHRNDACPCGSGSKFKRCCSPDAPTALAATKTSRAVQYIDTGEDAIRWVICDDTGVKFFSDKNNRILVFKTKVDATAVALLEEFSGGAPGEINVAGVGPTKWQHLQDILPFVEVDNPQEAAALLRERINVELPKYNACSDELDPPTTQEATT